MLPASLHFCGTLTPSKKMSKISITIQRFRDIPIDAEFGFLRHIERGDVRKFFKKVGDDKYKCLPTDSLCVDSNCELEYAIGDKSLYVYVGEDADATI